MSNAEKIHCQIGDIQTVFDNDLNGIIAIFDKSFQITVFCNSYSLAIGQLDNVIPFDRVTISQQVSLKDSCSGCATISYQHIMKFIRHRVRIIRFIAQ